MSLQFIFGRAHSGKTQFVLDKAKELYDNGESVIVMVPEQFTHLAEKRLISKLGSLQYDKAEVLSFDRLSNRINSLYPTNTKNLNSIGKSLIISEILEDTELLYYKKAKETVGFSDACNSEISEFKKYMISPEQLLNASEKTKNKALSLKLKDLSAIYTKYEDKLLNDFSDSDDSLGILAEILEKHKPYTDTTFIFDEFSSFNPQEIQIISLLACQAKNVYMTFCADLSDEYSLLFKSTIEMSAKIKKKCHESGCIILPDIRLTNSFYANKELCLLEKYLYADKMRTFEDKCPNIRVFKSENPYSEVERAATQICLLVRTGKVRYRDIGVVCADIDSYGCIFKSVFNSYDIPFFIDEKTNVLEHSIVCFVINIFDVYLNSYNEETVTNFLKSGCIDADRKSIFITDNFIMATRATKNTWLSDERWNKTVEFHSENDIDVESNLNFIRDNFILPLAKFHDSVKGRHTIEYITQKLYNYLLNIGFDKRIAQNIDIFKKSGNTVLAKQYELVWKTLIEAFDTLVVILGDKTVNLSEYRRFLYNCLNQQTIGVIPTSTDEIIIGDVLRSKSEYVDYQFIIGATESLFPTPSSEDVFISDAEKAVLSELGIELSPILNEKAFFDRFLTYSVLTHPQKALIMSYPSADADFSTTRPAFVFNILEKMFINLNAESNLDDDIFANIPLNEQKALEQFAKTFSEYPAKRPESDTWKDIYSYFSETDNMFKLKKLQGYNEKSKPVLKLNSELVDNLYGKEFYTTVSRIQKYNSCRYAYYLEYMLSLREKKKFGVESVEIGSLVHDIIEKIFTSAGNDVKVLRNTDNHFFINKAKEYLNEYIEKLYESSGEITEREIFNIKRLEDSVITSVLTIRNHIIRSEFEPIGHEIVFDEENIGCIEFELQSGKKVKITGKIDRADSFSDDDGTYVRVIDYKTGNKTFSYSDVLHGLDIQLLVYLNALVKDQDGKYPAGALFFRVQNPIEKLDSHDDDEKIEQVIKSALKMDGVISSNERILDAFAPDSVKTNNKLSSSQFRILGEYVDSVVRNSASALSSGEIDINPYCSGQNNNSCIYCPYNSICNFREGENGSFRILESCRYTKDMMDKISDVDDRKAAKIE